MRKKSEARRRAIMEVAAQVFAETGFERTSMSEIAAATGGSKATLYSYFPSKEALFMEIVMESSESVIGAVHDALGESTDNLREALLRFGAGLIGFLYSPELQAMRRLIIAEAGLSELGRHCYDIGPVRGQLLLANFLRRAMDSGQLRQTDAQIAAYQLRGLLEAELSEAFNFGTLEPLDTARIQELSERAVETFLRAYGIV